MAGIRKKMEYLKVLSWDLKYLFEDNKYIFIVDRTVALSMHSNKKIQVWAHMRPPPPLCLRMLVNVNWAKKFQMEDWEFI